LAQAQQQTPPQSLGHKSTGIASLLFALLFFIIDTLMLIVT
jgi:hypothetical protein